MLPSKNDPKWKALVTGEIKVTFNAISGNMILSRLSKDIKHNSSKENIEKSIEEAYNFFKKFELIFAKELEAIFK